MHSSSAIGAEAEAVERIVEESPASLEADVLSQNNPYRSSTPALPTLTEASPNSSEDATRIDHEVGQNIGAWLSSQSQGSQPDGPVNIEQVVVSPEQFDDLSAPQDSLPQTAVEISTEPAVPGSTLDSSLPSEGSATPQTLGRSFPPPGTLVVVQGVVHTTDVPPRLPSNDVQDVARRSSSTPPNPSGRRSRLSALLHSRPASMIAPRPPSAIDASSSAPPTPVVGDTTMSSNSNLPYASSNSPNSTSQIDPVDTPVQEGSSPPAEAAPSAEEPGTISSSSIDILGTLLRYFSSMLKSCYLLIVRSTYSVAAAATAASLLTGSSEPIMSSGLAPPAYNSDGTAPNTLPTDPWLPRPTSPTPTAGLGMGMGLNTDNPRPDRLRNAWGSIRERLGLRPSPAPSSESGSNSDTPSILSANDPREVMMAQMARAFNLGFGMGGEGLGSGSGSESGRSEQTGDGAMPPEGSFERFLIDLQADLRVALTSPGGFGGDAGNASEQQQLQAPTAPSDSSASTSSDAFPQANANSLRQVFAAPNVSDNNNQDEDDMPELGSVSDSDSEFLDAHEEGDNAVPALAPVDVTADPGPSRAAPAVLDNDNNRSAEGGAETATSERETAAADASPSNAQTGGAAPRRINWWRLYRFPPITAPRTYNAAGITTTTPSPFGLNAFPTPPPPPHPDLAPPLPEMDPTLAELPFANADEADGQAQPPHMVVPVIVVGLQSVNTTTIIQQHQGTTDDGESSSDGEGEEDGDTEGSTSNGRHGEQGRNTTAGRGRPWHTRAADAIRNLRPGRRHRAVPAAVLPGRTFLIYVIGGTHSALFLLCNVY